MQDMSLTNFEPISNKSENVYFNEIQIRFSRNIPYMKMGYTKTSCFICLFVCLFVCLISVIKMILIINSIPWVRCASGNVFNVLLHMCIFSMLFNMHFFGVLFDLCRRNLSFETFTGEIFSGAILIS